MVLYSTHSNPTAMKILAPAHGFQSLSFQMHWACTPEDTALISCAPVQLQTQDLATQYPDPLASNGLSKLPPDPKQLGNCLSTATLTKAKNGSFYGVTAMLQKRLQCSSSPNLGQGTRTLWWQPGSCSSYSSQESPYRPGFCWILLRVSSYTLSTPLSTS